MQTLLKYTQDGIIISALSRNINSLKGNNTPSDNLYHCSSFVFHLMYKYMKSSGNKGTFQNHYVHL